jgi:hypothetical protein
MRTHVRELQRERARRVLPVPRAHCASQFALSIHHSIVTMALFAAVGRLGCKLQRAGHVPANLVVRVLPVTHNYDFQARFLATSSEERQVKRQAAVAARRARKKAAQEKEQAVKAYQESLSKQVLQRQEAELQENPQEMESEQERLEKQEMRSQEREELMLEAGAMSRSLFRTCLRCVKIMREGNETDEEDFLEREKNQFQSMKEAVAAGTFSMAPPVDRENELSSRANYYHGHTRENFDGDSDCLKPDPWKEENVDLYLDFLRGGEYKRKWVMNDYKFHDPYVDVFDNDRVDRWEARARELLKKTYDANGWILPSEHHSKKRQKTKWEDDDDDQPLI